MLTEDQMELVRCDRLNKTPTYEEFFSSYLKPNVPVIIGPSLVQSWSAFDLWVTKKTPSSSESGDATLGGGGNNTASTSQINWNYLSDTYGCMEVTVADCSNPDELGNQERETKKFGDIVDEWKRGEGRSMYVKDWHLPKNVKGPVASGEQASTSTNRAFYTTPDIFRDDWMNAYYSAYTDDDFRFVYVGAQGTFTPLHRDVYTSYSWSTNICGRKRWWLFPPEQTRYLLMTERSIAAYDVRTANPKDFPEIHRASPIVVDQEDGETIFVPSGWYHQVENLTPCISINHNWCNSVNLPSLYKSMCDKVLEVENALGDVREMLSANDTGDDWRLEWIRIVQDVVRQDAGWNWLTFWSMVLHALQGTARMDNLLEGKVQAPSQPLFLHASEHLRPPMSFICERVQACYDDFVRRDRRERELGVDAVVEKVVHLLKRMEVNNQEQQLDA